MSSEIQIAHLCLANAFRDEKNETYRYGKRHSKFLRFMRSFESKPQIVSIKELRKCRDENGETELDPNDILNSLAVAGRYAVADCQPVKHHDTNRQEFYNPFYLGQLYDNKVLYKVSSKIVPYYLNIYDTPESAPNMGGSYLFVEYAPRNANGIPDLDRKFSVATVHFPLQEHHKLLSAKYFNKETSQLPDVLVGDFNLFKDDNLYSQIYDEILVNFRDVITDNLVNQNGEKMYGTFYPFPHDLPPVPILHPNLQKQDGVEGEPSHLDYVFISKNSKLKSGQCKVLTYTYNESNPDEVWTYDETTFPISDHLPLLVNLSV